VTSRRVIRIIDSMTDAAIRPSSLGGVARLSPLVPRRTAGQWAADSALFVVAILVWWFYGFALTAALPSIPDWYWPIDRILGLVACLSLWWGRRYPRAIAVALIVPGALAVSAGAAALIGVYRVGQLARPRHSVPITVGHVALALPYHWFLPLEGMTWLVWVIVIPLMYALALSLGLLSRSRRQVIEGLRESAARDRERYDDTLASIRRDEREKIAREMHDVLAHRISLLSVHAGALEYRSAPGGQSPTPAEIHEAAVVIRNNAHGAIEDLRELLTLLRTEDDAQFSLSTGRPQPRLDSLTDLVDEVRAAGERVELDYSVDAATVRESAQRTLYRAVQEGLTNARKHAPNARVNVAVRATPEGVMAEVSNQVAVGMTATDIPGGGSGLVGLAERVRLDGGTMSAGVEDGSFRLRVELPQGPR
jgi:signal transduction histidine kinase